MAKLQKIKVETLVPFGRHWPRFERLQRLQTEAFAEVAALDDLTVTVFEQTHTVRIRNRKTVPKGTFETIWRPPVGIYERPYWFWILESSAPVDVDAYQRGFAELNPQYPSINPTEGI